MGTIKIIGIRTHEDRAAIKQWQIRAERATHELYRVARLSPTDPAANAALTIAITTARNSGVSDSVIQDAVRISQKRSQTLWKQPRDIKSEQTLEEERQLKEKQLKERQWDETNPHDLKDQKISSLEKDIKIAKLEKELAELKKESRTWKLKDYLV